MQFPEDLLFVVVEFAPASLPSPQRKMVCDNSHGLDKTEKLDPSTSPPQIQCGIHMQGDANCFSIIEIVGGGLGLNFFYLKCQRL